MTGYEAEDFRRLIDKYFGRGFASLTKTEVEIYLFDIYMAKLERENMVSSYYQIGRQLGISESRVRTLAEKRSLLFQEQPDMQECLLYLMEQAPANLVGQDKEQRLRIQINDVNYLHALQDYLESQAMGYEPELSGKALRITLQDFLSVIEIEFGPEASSAALEALWKQAEQSGKQLGVSKPRHLVDIAKDPDTYFDLLEPLIVDKNAVKFTRRLAEFIREARAAAKAN